METRRKEAMTFEPNLLITLGPPPDGWERELFDEYQREMEAKGFSGGPHRWEEYEREIIEEALFGQGAGGRSGFDELLSQLYRIGIKVTKHSIGYGINRGLRVVSMETLFPGDLEATLGPFLRPGLTRLTREPLPPLGAWLRELRGLVSKEMASLFRGGGD